MEEETPKPSPPPPCWSSIVSKPQLPKPEEDVKNGIFLEECKSSNGISIAVIDANAVIQGGEKLKDYADKFVSVSQVLDEIRDPVSRQKLAFVPFDIQTMEPSSEALKTVISFARATGDLQTLSDVDLKLIALTYTLEAQIHGTKHLKNSPPPVHMVNKRMAEKEMPGWGSNVPNLEEWEAIENAVEVDANLDSRILPLKDLNLNVITADGHVGSQYGDAENSGEHAEAQDVKFSFRKPRRYTPVKKDINIEGKKMISDGIDASQGQLDDNTSDWQPAVSRSTHRRFLRRKGRRELSEVSSEKDDHMVELSTHSVGDDGECPELLLEGSEIEGVENEVNSDVARQNIGDGDLSSILNQMRLEEDLSNVKQSEKEVCMVEKLGVSSSGLAGVVSDIAEENAIDLGDDRSYHPEISSQTSENIDASYVDDNSSEQSWMLRSLSESSVACVTTDFAMQNVILQIGLRLLAPGGMQIRELHRWILKCHACNKITAEIGRIFCPKCGNGGTLRKVAVTVGENGIVLAARKPRIILRGTKFSLPMPQGGRDAITKNLILREDQLPHKVLYPKTKKKMNKEGDDIFASDDIFSHSSDKRVPLQPPIRKALAVFSGKRNPNDNHYSRAKH